MLYVSLLLTTQFHILINLKFDPESNCKRDNYNVTEQKDVKGIFSLSLFCQHT